jgi:hypothetical protein
MDKSSLNMTWLNLTVEQATQINESIDKVHNPYYWTFIAIVGVVFLFDSFLPIKSKFESDFDRVFSYFKFYTIIFFTLIALSQGLSGGCIIQIPQNWIAQTYLDRPYWYPYGPVFRELLPEQYWFVLVLGYFFGSLFAAFRAYRFWQKRILAPAKTHVNYA